MNEPIENEIKLKVADRAATRAKLEAIGATLARARHFEDNLLYDDRQHSLRARGVVLRLRHNDQGACLTVKGPKREVQGVKARTEAEVTVSDGATAETILRLLGYEPVFRYQKYREVWHWQEAEVVVDDTPVGTYLEIEGPLPEIHAAASALGHTPDDYLLDSYAALFVMAGGSGDMIFPERPRQG
jgi:adenylate cyclase, class 2